MVIGNDGWKIPFLFGIASFQVLSPVFLWVVEIDLNRTGASAKPLFLPNDCLCQPKQVATESTCIHDNAC